MASGSNIPPEVQRFVQTHLGSAAQLEALLLVAERANRTWSAAEVSDELRSERNLMASALAELTAAGLLAEADAGPGGEWRYCYQPETPALAAMVQALGVLYRERRHAVIALIYTRPQPAPDPARAFADAFRLRAPDERN